MDGWETRTIRSDGTIVRTTQDLDAVHPAHVSVGVFSIGKVRAVSFDTAVGESTCFIVEQDNGERTRITFYNTHPNLLAEVLREEHDRRMRAMLNRIDAMLDAPDRRDDVVDENTDDWNPADYDWNPADDEAEV